MADKTDEPTTPTGESPVYDSLVDGGEPVVATVDAESDAAEADAAPVEPEEIIVEEDTQTVEYVDDEPVAVHEATTVYEQPAPVPPQPQVVYREAPAAPVDRGNRAFGALISIAATVVFLVVLAVVMVIIYSAQGGSVTVDFLSKGEFYVPALFFLIGSVVLALLLNRAGWWTYVIGSLVLAVFVYFGTIGAILLTSGVVLLTPEAAAEQFRLGTTSPFTIAAALVAREVSLWAGAIIASRGRKLKVRNADARADFEREQANTRGY